MKITYSSNYGITKLKVSIEDAIKGTIDDAGNGYDGQIERLRGQLDKQTEIIAKLVEFVLDPNHEQSRVSKIRDLLGYAYDVED